MAPRITPLTDNPIIQHNLFGRQPKWRYSSMISLICLGFSPALLLLAGFMLFAGLHIWEIYHGWSDPNYAQPLLERLRAFGLEVIFNQAIPGMAKVLAYLIPLALLIIIMVTAPARAIGAIAAERQQQTLDALLITLLSPSQIIIGKWIVALVRSSGPLLISCPLLMLCFALRGIEPVFIGPTMLLLITTLMSYTAIGLFGSTLAGTTAKAARIVYGLLLPIVVFAPVPFMWLFPLLTFFLRVTIGVDFGYKTYIAINTYGWWAVISTNPVAAAIFSVMAYEDNGSLILITSGPYNLLWIHPWILCSIFLIFMTWVFVRLSVWRLRKIG